MTNILCIGAGYVGGSTMPVVASHCPEHRFVVVDINEGHALRRGNPINFPSISQGWTKLSARHGEKLFFSPRRSIVILQRQISYSSA